MTFQELLEPRSCDRLQLSSLPSEPPDNIALSQTHLLNGWMDGWMGTCMQKRTLFLLGMQARDGTTSLRRRLEFALTAWGWHRFQPGGKGPSVLMPGHESSLVIQELGGLSGKSQMELMYQGVTLSKLFIRSDTVGDWQVVTGQIDRSQAHRRCLEGLMLGKLEARLWRVGVPLPALWQVGKRCAGWKSGHPTWVPVPRTSWVS